MLRRLQSTLVVAEHADNKLSAATLSAVTAAKQVGQDVTCIVAGANCKQVRSCRLPRTPPAADSAAPLAIAAAGGSETYGRSVGKLQ